MPPPAQAVLAAWARGGAGGGAPDVQIHALRALAALGAALRDAPSNCAIGALLLETAAANAAPVAAGAWPLRAPEPARPYGLSAVAILGGGGDAGSLFALTGSPHVEAVIAIMDVYAEDDLNEEVALPPLLPLSPCSSLLHPVRLSKNASFLPPCRPHPPPPPQQPQPAGPQVMRPLGVLPRLTELNKGVAAAVTAWLAAEKQRLKASGKVRCRCGGWVGDPALGARIRDGLLASGCADSFGPEAGRNRKQTLRTRKTWPAARGPGGG
jgi:hypothetical protein